MKRNVPEYNAGEDEGIDNWVARFKWEYPWEVMFTAVDAEDPQRMFYKNFTGDAVVTDLMAQMGADDMDQTVDSGTTQAQAAGLEHRGEKRPPGTPSEELENKQKEEHERKAVQKADNDWKKSTQQQKYTPEEMAEWRAEKSKEWVDKKGAAAASSSWNPGAAQQDSLLAAAQTASAGSGYGKLPQGASSGRDRGEAPYTATSAEKEKKTKENEAEMNDL